jgi:hypothetical protein
MRRRDIYWTREGGRRDDERHSVDASDCDTHVMPWQHYREFSYGGEFPWWESWQNAMERNAGLLDFLDVSRHGEIGIVGVSMCQQPECVQAA